MDDKVFPYRYYGNKIDDVSGVHIRIRLPGGDADLQVPLGGYQKGSEENQARYRTALKEIVLALSEYAESDPPLVPPSPAE